MIRVYTDMVADLFHAGHVRFLERARQLGDCLLVGIHSDHITTSYKRDPVMDMDERVSLVGACRYVDCVIPDAPLVVSKSFIETHAIDLVVHAHPDEQREPFDRFYRYPMDAGKFVRLEYSGGVSTSILIDRINANRGTGSDRDEA